MGRKPRFWNYQGVGWKRLELGRFSLDNGARQEEPGMYFETLNQGPLVGCEINLEGYDWKSKKKKNRILKNFTESHTYCFKTFIWVVYAKIFLVCLECIQAYPIGIQ